MSRPLRVAAIQLNITETDIKVNIKTVGQLLNRINGQVDLVVLPEMFTTGFITDSDTANALAETMYGQSITTMQEWARCYRTAIVSSLIIKENGKLYNRALFIDDTGTVLAKYDKHHLFAMSNEADTFSPGNDRPPIVTYKGMRISMSICYDIRFPAWMRNTTPYYDLMIVMANWPDSRQYAWEHLLIARAIENQAYVIGCNRTGSDPYGTYSGTSLIISPKGQPIHIADDPILTADIDLDSLNSFRKKFPVYLHGDKFTIDT